jgi:hypothetical protein
MGWSFSGGKRGVRADQEARQVNEIDVLALSAYLFASDSAAIFTDSTMSG